MARLSFVLLGTLLLAGCVTENTTPKRFPLDTTVEAEPPVPLPPVSPPPSRPPRQPAPPLVRPTTLPVAPTAHDCQEQLDELCGPLLIYYKAYGKMPPTLEELKRFKEFQDLGDFKCPVSRLPYTYIPLGARGPDEELVRENKPTVKVLTYVIVADPTPVHGGVRHAIFVVQLEGSEDISLRRGILPEK